MQLFLSNQVLIYLFSEMVLFTLAIVAFIGSIHILQKWDFNTFSATQYKLEKKAYLIVLIIYFSLIFKIILIPYFAYTIDQLATIVPGAMCAAGVINANELGNYLMFIKILLLLSIGIWMVINHLDVKAVNYPYFKTKFWFFMMIFILMTVELGVDFAYFSQISLKQPVSCCSTIFGISGSNVLPFGLNITTLLILFYLLYLLSIILSFQKSALLLALSSGLFLVIAYLAVNHFFGTYIYQLPTHICPFCMLQSEYYYIGYLLWPLLFLSTFFGVANLLLKLLLKTELNNLYRLSRIFNTSFVILCSTYPLMYYFKNGVWL